MKNIEHLWKNIEKHWKAMTKTIKNNWNAKGVNQPWSRASAAAWCDRHRCIFRGIRSEGLLLGASGLGLVHSGEKDAEDAIPAGRHFVQHGFGSWEFMNFIICIFLIVWIANVWIAMTLSPDFRIPRFSNRRTNSQAIRSHPDLSLNAPSDKIPRGPT